MSAARSKRRIVVADALTSARHAISSKVNRDLDRPVNKLQTFDVVEDVGTVVDDPEATTTAPSATTAPSGVHHMLDRNCAGAVGSKNRRTRNWIHGRGDHIVRAHVGEYGGIDVTGAEDRGIGIGNSCIDVRGIPIASEKARRTKLGPDGLIVEDFADDQSACGSAGELDVETCITVDDVITPAASEEVAATAAEQDVAAGKGDGPCGEVVCQSVDEIDVGEFVEGVDFGIVGALDEVAKGGAAGGFGLDEEVADGIATQRLRLVGELAPLHVDADGMILILP